MVLGKCVWDERYERKLWPAELVFLMLRVTTRNDTVGRMLFFSVGNGMSYLAREILLRARPPAHIPGRVLLMLLMNPQHL